MALTLIKEDGTGRTDANSYATVAEADSYFEAHLYAAAWTAATAATKASALVMATRLVDSQYQFNGYRAHDTQALQWPRRQRFDAPVAIHPQQQRQRFGAAPVHGETHYADYTALNGTLSERIDGAKAELHVRLLGDLLPPVSQLEDAIAAFSVTAAREAAWNHGEILWALRPLPDLSARTADTLDGMTALIGKTLLVPVA